MTVRILNGDVRAMLKTLPDESVHAVVTSPPYFGLRCYGTAAQIWGAEEMKARISSTQAEEREACAKVAEEQQGAWDVLVKALHFVRFGDAYKHACQDIAVIIRARATKE